MVSFYDQDFAEQDPLLLQAPSDSGDQTVGAEMGMVKDTRSRVE
jgi:hypothetical protein